jgi:tetratricopeptide (TPR) repeat protein
MLNSDLSKRKRVFAQVLSFIRWSFPRWDPLIPFDSTDPRTFGPYEKYLPQLLSLYRSAQEPAPALDGDLDFAAILGQAGVYMWRIGLLKDCREVTERAEVLLKQCGISVLDPRFADVSSTLAILCTFEGVSRRQEGIDRSLQVLRIREKIHEKYDPVPLSIEKETWSAWADLACAHLEEENFAQVEEIMERVKNHYRAWGTEVEEPFHWSRYYHHMSFVKMSQGQVRTALDWSKTAVDLQERAGGAESTMAQLYRFALGQLLYHAGYHRQAGRLLDQIASDCEDLFGEFSTISITTQFARGVLRWINGDLETAE